MNDEVILAIGICAVPVGIYGIYATNKLISKRMELKHEEKLPVSYWLAKEAEAKASIEIARIKADADIQKHKDTLEAEKGMPDGYFQAKIAEMNTQLEKIKAEKEAHAKIVMNQSDNATKKAISSDKLIGTMSTIGSLASTANHTINAVSNASREVRQYAKSYS
jgi:hypothetical protein